MMKKILNNFFKCGLTGWCMEIIFTAFGSLQKRDLRLMGRTSLWMFPIYGSACFLAPLFKASKKLPLLIRGTLYALCIFTGEYLSGRFLHRRRLCPWSYEGAKWRIGKVIRLDYFPNWFLAGLLFEKLLSKSTAAPPENPLT